MNRIPASLQLALGLSLSLALPLSTQARADSARNQDTQVLSVSDMQGACIRIQGAMCSGNAVVDQERCSPIGMDWDQVRASKPGAFIRLDCTSALASGWDPAPLRTVVISGYRNAPHNEKAYGLVGFSDNTGLFFMKKVLVAVKEAALASPSFHGMSLYLNELTYAPHQGQPQPGDDNGGARFFDAEWMRAEAKHSVPVTLKNGEPARVIALSLPVPFAHGGSSYVNAYFFRPFAEYRDQGQVFRRYDEVAQDYFVGSATSFDRTYDVVR